MLKNLRLSDPSECTLSSNFKWLYAVWPWHFTVSAIFDTATICSGKKLVRHRYHECISYTIPQQLSDESDKKMNSITR